jgi:phenylpropionate dioxygenase-like ring-hydroxylating dioxygenase large terminal subunit
MTNKAFDEDAVSRRFLESDWAPARYAFSDAWQPIAHARDIGEFATRRQIHSEPCYLWRAKGRFHASRRHPQRAEQRRCRAGNGYAPAAEYAVAERYGYAWVWFGDPDRAHASLIPDVPFLPVDGDLPPYMRGTVRFDCCSSVLIENLLDSTHAGVVLTRAFGDERTDEHRIEVQYTSETVTMICTCTRRSVAPIMRWFGGVRVKYQDVRVAIHVHVRNSVVLAYGRCSPGVDLKLFHPCVPESRRQCRLNFTLDSRCAPFPLRYMMPLTPYVLVPRENVAAAAPSSGYAGPSSRRDSSSRFDGADARYREVALQLAQRQFAGDFGYAADAHPGRDVRALLGMTG